MPPVYLNHLLVFVDRDTYRALSASGFLNEHFACAEERTTHDQATDMSWTGRYYYGRQTYFEFMNPDQTSWAPRDGLAFSIESEDESEALARRLEQSTDREVRRYKRSRRYQEQDIPWFWMVEVPRGDDARLISWVMEYDPGFLDRWAPHLPPGRSDAEPSDISRAGFLTRYRAAIGDDLPNRLFRDVTSVTVTLPSDEADRLEAELRIFGYGEIDMDDAANGDVEADSTVGRDRVTFRGPDLDIVVERMPGDDDRPGEKKAAMDREIGGITAFTMETRPVSVTTTHTFGPACRLTVDRMGKATWSFRPSAR